MIAKRPKMRLSGTVLIMTLMSACIGCTFTGSITENGSTVAAGTEMINTETISTEEITDKGQKFVELDLFIIPISDWVKEQSSFQLEDNGDVTVLHRVTGDKIGRFCAVSYQQALDISADNVIVIINEYGSNPILRMALENGEGVSGEDSAGEDSAIYVGDGEALGDDAMSEESKVYLPDEKISHRVQAKPCYLFVPAKLDESEENVRKDLVRLQEELSAQSEFVVVKEEKESETTAHTYIPAEKP